MAKVIYALYQNQNKKQSKAYGKYYARVSHVETINLDGLADHIAEHGSVYTPDVVLGVLKKFQSCIIEMLMQSKKVKIDGLGTFYATCKSEGSVTVKEFNAGKMIHGLRLRFTPDRSDKAMLDSKSLLRKASFVNVREVGISPEPEAAEDETTDGEG